MATSAQYNEIKSHLQQQGSLTKQQSNETQRSTQYNEIKKRLQQQGGISKQQYNRNEYVNKLFTDALESNGGAAVYYARAVDQMKAAGVNSGMMDGLLKEKDWNSLREQAVKAYESGSGKMNLAAVAYDNYTEYLRAYVSMATNISPTGNLQSIDLGENYESTGSAPFDIFTAEYLRRLQNKDASAVKFKDTAAADYMADKADRDEAYVREVSHWNDRAIAINSMGAAGQRIPEHERSMLTWIGNTYGNTDDALAAARNTAFQSRRAADNLVATNRAVYADDFAEKSVFDSRVTDETYRKVNTTGADNFLEAPEIAVYNYIFATEGAAKAQAYLDTLENTLNERKGQAKADSVNGKFLGQMWIKAQAGFDQFGTGIASLFNTDGVMKDPSVTQYASAAVDEDLANLGVKWYDFAEGEEKVFVPKIFGRSLAQMAGDTVQTVANMAPSIALASAATAINPTLGSWVGAVAMGSSAAGNAYQDMLNQGYSKSDAATYGVLVGVSEATLEKVLGGISPISGGGGLQKFASKFAKVDGVLKRFAESTGGKILLNAGSEAMEEGLQSVLEPFFKTIVTGEEFTVDMEEALYSALMGFVTGGMFEGTGVGLSVGPSAVVNTANKLMTNVNAKKNYGTSQQELVAAVLALDPGNAFALKMQGLLDKGKNLTGSQLNKLVQMNEAAIKQGAPSAEATQQSQAGEVSSVSNVDGAQNTALRTPSQPSEGQDGIRQNQSPTFQEEVQRQFERNNGYGKTAPKIYDVDKVFSAAQSAHSSGAISEERYSEIVDALSFAQSDYAEGNITEAEYQGMLETAMRQVAQHPGQQMAPAVSATDPMVNVDRPTWQQAQRLAKALGRDIVFYNGPRGENGYYKDGTIYVNILADDPFAQVVSHELTHSLEGTRHYDRLKRFVFEQLSRKNIDIAQARKAKYDQYKSHGKDLQGDTEIDAEIVAEYVQKYLLTDEQSIMDLVAAEPNVAKRIWSWLNNFARRIVGDQTSRERAKLEQITRIYGKALQESRDGYGGSGTVSVRSQAVAGGQTWIGDLQQSREQTESDYREGRISDEEYDAAMDEYDRAEEERLGHSLEKYSVGTVQKNTTGNGGVMYSQGQGTAQADITVRYQATVDQILNMQNTKKDHLIIGYTPDVYKSLGMPSLPFVIGTGHVYSAAKTEAEARQDGNFRKGIHYHGLGANTVKNIYEALKDPVMIIASKDVGKNVTPLRSTHSVVAIVDIGNAENSLLLPVEITAERTVNGVRMDVNALSSIYERDVTPLIKEAIAQENTGDIGVYYAKKEALTLPGAGVRFPIRLQQSIASNSIIHRFSEKVNMNIQDATQSQQFKRWFGDWQNYPEGSSKVVNADGTPKVVYHGSYSNFSVFDGKIQKHSDAPRDTHFFTDDIDVGYSYTGYKNVAAPGGHAYKGGVYKCYLNIRNPYTADFQGMHWSDKVNGMDINELAQYAKDHGYDGLIAHNVIDEGGQGDVNWDENVPKKPATTYVVFTSEQIKSATDNIGTFDGNNPDIRYSFSDTLAEEDGRRPMEGSYTTDEVEMQARKKGYPVLHGEQIVPFRTWVRTVDRGNYGLVTGMAPENKLLVSFHNKHDGGTADNVPIAYENLVPVPGTYQMTKEEFASLMESEPMDPGSDQLSEEDMREIEELYNQARSGEDKAANPIDLEKLPKKAQNYLKRAQRKLLNKLCNTLGVPRSAMMEHLQSVVEDVTGEYLNTGTVSDEKLRELFDKAYEQGIVTDREFYDQYKHIKDHLRTTAVTLSEQDRSNIADFNDFRRRQFGRLRIVNQGGLPVDTAYGELQNMAPELFPETITHPADQLVQMSDVARSIEISQKTLDEYAGPERETFRSWAKHDFDVAVGEIMGDLHAVRRFADDRAARAAREPAPATPEEAMEAYKKLKNARRLYERVSAKNLLTQHDEAQVGRLLRHEIELEHLDPEKDNVNGITAVYEAKAEYERLCKLISEYKRHLHGKLRDQADQYLKTANDWKDKKVGIAYARETMRRNIYDVVTDRSLAREINDVYFEPVHDAEAKAVRLKDEYRNKVREMNLSRKVASGNLVSEAHAVQLLGEAMDNIRILENTRGRMQHRDGKTLADWRGVVMKLWNENPNLNQEKIQDAVQQFRQIYDNLFVQMNKVRVENGYEPINYRSGYFPHFQPGEADGILAQFGRAMGIDTQVVALPTTITGLTHTFKPGIQWFGNAQERLGFNTAYDAVEGFDKYIEGAASVIYQTENIQRLRALATQVRYRTSNEGIQEQVDAVYEDNRLTDEEKQVKIASIYEHGKFALANFVAELDEYTNLLANKKSKYDRTVEALMGRRVYAFLKWWESRVGANMIAGNLSSALTNFIPLTQAGAQMDSFAILDGMWKTLSSYKIDDGLQGASSFLTNRKGSDPLVQNWSQKVSGKLSIPMEAIDQFVSGSIVRGAYHQNLKRGMSDAEAMYQADIFAAGVMADRSKGSMPTLMQASNPLFKMFTQFQLEVNNQFSEVFKDLPRNHMQQGIIHFAWVLFKYFLGAWLFNELYAWLIGRRPALDPIGLLIDAGKDFADPDVGFGEGMKNLGTNVLSELPFSSGLTLLGIETDGGRIPASSAVPDLTAIWDAATAEDMHWKKRLKEIGDEVSKPLTYVVPPFGGNQASKIWKGTKALIEGGSYSVDSQGNDILQYPVYNDDPWSALGSLLRTTLFGKSSLPEAQDWVESGFDSLGAKETAVYQDMIDDGIPQRAAFELIQQMGAAKRTDSMTADEAKRNILRNSKVADEGKAVAYYGLLASDKERGIMDTLAEMGADTWEATKTLMAMKDAGKLEGTEITKAKYDAIIQAALTDEEKAVLVGAVVGTDLETEKGNLTQYAKFKIAVEGGMSVDEYLQFRKAGGDIDDYLDFSNAGLDTDDAVEISLALDELVPLAGEERVSEIQRWRTCIDTFSHTATQLAALAGVMTDKQYAKVELAYDYSISPGVYVTLQETLVRYDANGNGSLSSSEVTAAINSMRGLSTKQKAVLWQISVSSKSAKNNPYSPQVGEQVLKDLNKE